MSKTRYLSPPPGNSKMSELLYGKLKTSGKKCYQIEAELNVSATTLRKALKHPESVNMDMLRSVAKKLNVTKSEFCMALDW